MEIAPSPALQGEVPMRPVLICLVMLCSHAALAESATVAGVRIHQHGTLAMRVMEVRIQAPDLIEVLPVADSALQQLQLTLAPGQKHEGLRMAQVRQRRRLRAGRYPLYRAWEQARDYAIKHGGRGPKQVDDLNEEGRKLLSKSPWPDEPDAKPPFYALVPDVPFPAKGRDWQSRSVFAVELCPYLDDGKHHVLYAGGRVERVEVDPALLAKIGATLRPLHSHVTAEDVQGTMRYSIYALVAPRNANWELTLRDVRSGDTQRLQLDSAQAQAGGPEIFKSWAQLRAADWDEQRELAPASALGVWSQLSRALCGTGGDGPRQRGRGRGNQASMLNVLGGRAAISETLQMQALDTKKTKEPATIQVPRSPASRSSRIPTQRCSATPRAAACPWRTACQPIASSSTSRGPRLCRPSSSAARPLSLMPGRCPWVTACTTG
ncbi:MAG: hypothetical protein ACI8W8_004568 [Rhodothermales bacterium]|jgi:hypothetical protein